MGNCAEEARLHSEDRLTAGGALKSFGPVRIRAPSSLRARLREQVSAGSFRSRRNAHENSTMVRP